MHETDRPARRAPHARPWHPFELLLIAVAVWLLVMVTLVCAVPVVFVAGQ